MSSLPWLMSGGGKLYCLGLTANSRPAVGGPDGRPLSGPGSESEWPSSAPPRSFESDDASRCAGSSRSCETIARISTMKRL
eukprot:2609541-Prymnesium_polylepis.1